MTSYRWLGQILVNAVSFVLIGIAFLGFSHSTLAGEIPKAVTQAIADLIPELQPHSIVATPISNLYLVSFGVQLAYVSSDGQYLLTGDLIEVNSGRNLAEDVRRRFRKEVVANLDDSGMVIFSPTDIRSTITVFTDISCPYCVRFHQEINDLINAGIEVRYAGFPRAGIPSNAHDALVSVWCADNPQKAMTDAKAGLDIEDSICNTSIDEHMEVAETIGVRGTPTIVLESGKMIPGYITADQLVLEVSMESD